MTLVSSTSFRLRKANSKKLVLPILLIRIYAAICIVSYRCVVSIYLSTCMRAKWQLAALLYKKSRTLVCCRYKFDEAMVLEFQKTVNNFYDLWLKVTGKHGMGNYMHMLAMGHIGDQLTRFGNLHIYFQQGWETLNINMKKIYFNQTALDGGCN